MTPKERQALREKHTEIIFREGVSCCSLCHHEWYGFAVVVPYPCDVIKALDEVDRVMNAAEVYGMVARAMVEQNSNGTITELANCDHWVTVKRSGQYGYASSVLPEYWTHTFCPKCGEKL